MGYIAIAWACGLIGFLIGWWAANAIRDSRIAKLAEEMGMKQMGKCVCEHPAGVHNLTTAQCLIGKCACRTYHPEGETMACPVCGSDAERDGASELLWNDSPIASCSVCGRDFNMLTRRVYYNAR